MAKQAGRTEYQRAYYKRRTENGICVKCMSPVVPGSVYCAEHREAKAAWAAGRRQTLKASGLCVRCAAPAVAGFTLCDTHLAAARQQSGKTRQRRMAKGMCPACGKRPPDAGHGYCPECREYYRRQPISPRSYKMLDGARALVDERDGNACRLCGRHGKTIHHIDGNGNVKLGIRQPNPNNRLDNLITLCKGCHEALEKLLRVRNIEAAVFLLRREYPSQQHAVREAITV